MPKLVPSDTADTPRPAAGNDSRSQNTPSPSSDFLRYRAGISAVAAVILIICIGSYIVRWADGRFSHDRPVSRVVCRGPEGDVEILPRGTTVGQALEDWEVDTAGIDAHTLKRRIPDGSRIAVVDTRTGPRAVIEELPPAERYALGLDFDINKAGIPDLVLIPGIGEASAARIVAYRRAHGAFLSEAALGAVPGLGSDRARTIMRYVSFGSAITDRPKSGDTAPRNGPKKAKAPGSAEKLSTGDPPVDINRAAAADLMRIPGVGEKTAERIIACREKNGPFAAVADLERVEGIGKKKAEKIAGYVRF